MWFPNVNYGIPSLLLNFAALTPSDYADACHPDWRVWVNGVPEEIQRANILFKAADVGPGKSVVEWRFGGFRRRLLTLGLLLTGCVAFVAIQGSVVACALGALRCASPERR